MYCGINKQGVTNFRSTNSAQYELACASIAKCNTSSYISLKSVNILVLYDKLINVQGNLAIVSYSLCMLTVCHEFEPSRSRRSV